MNKDEVLSNALEFEHEFKDSKITALKARASYLSLHYNQCMAVMLLYVFIGAVLYTACILLEDSVLRGVALATYGLLALHTFTFAVKAHSEKRILDKEIWRLRKEHQPEAQ